MEYIFETERLRIRKFEMEDAKCIYMIYQSVFEMS